MRRPGCARLHAPLIVLAALLAVFAAPPSAAAAGTCPPLDYLAGIRQAQAALHASPADTAGALAALRQMIAAYPSTQQTLAPVLDRLQASPPETGGAQATLDAVAGTLALPPGTTCNADQRPARSALDGVYASPVFANLDRKPPGPNPIAEFLQWLGSVLRSITGSLGTAGSIALGAGLVAAALAIAAWRLRGNLGARPAAVGDEAEPGGDDPARQWRLAEQAARRGEYREAIRRAFRSALLAVAVRGRLPVDPSWTTHELLAATQGDARLLAVLAPAAAMFDRAWYSGVAVTAEDWQEARARCTTVRDLARAKATVVAR